MMIFLKFIIGVMVINLLSILTIHALVASFNPSLYGKYLQTLDDSRYEYMEP